MPSEIIWPSDQDRAENDQLNEMCEYAEELLQENERLDVTTTAARTRGADIAIFVALQVLRQHDQPIIAKDLVDADVGIDAMIQALDCPEGVDYDSLFWLCSNECREKLRDLNRRAAHLVRLDIDS